jgi:hypothetical protein
VVVLLYAASGYVAVCCNWSRFCMLLAVALLYSSCHYSGCRIAASWRPRRCMLLMVESPYAASGRGTVCCWQSRHYHGTVCWRLRHCHGTVCWRSHYMLAVAALYAAGSRVTVTALYAGSRCTVWWRSRHCMLAVVALYAAGSRGTVTALYAGSRGTVCWRS